MSDKTLSSYRCTNCGAPIEIQPWDEIVKCEYCETVFKVEKTNNEEIVINNIQNITVEKKGFAQSAFEYFDKRAAARERAEAEERARKAEAEARKRQIWLINTLKDLLKDSKNIHLLLPGKDSLNGKCEKLVNELNLDKQVHLLGFRNDIPKLLRITNLAVTSSLHEGLPVNVMEAIYEGIPVVATDCRGNKDLIEDGKNGFVVSINDSDMFCQKIMKVLNMNKSELNKIKKLDKIIIEKYLLKNVIDKIIEIYLEK